MLKIKINDERSDRSSIELELKTLINLNDCYFYSVEVVLAL